MNELQDYAGVIHVHTAYSDSYGRMPYIVECARAAGLDYVVVTDHNTLESRREGWQGWHDGVLLAIGTEVTSSKGHSLILGLDECPRWNRTHPDEYLPEAARLGGTAFVAHPERTNRGKLYREPQAWPNLKTDDYAGIEIWSYIHDWVEYAFPWHILKALRNPDSAIAGPHREVLLAWDRMALRRHVAGIGALDSHELRFPGRYFKWSPIKVISTKYLFRTVRTHVLLPRWSGDAAKDLEALTSALTGGRCFVGYDLLANSSGTRFLARSTGAAPEPAAVMGQRVEAGGDLEFVAALPCDAEILLLRNSEVAASAKGRELVHRDRRPGVYRVEARLDGRPWVFTNHIYVT